MWKQICNNDSSHIHIKTLNTLKGKYIALTLIKTPVFDQCTYWRIQTGAHDVMIYN